MRQGEDDDRHDRRQKAAARKGLCRRRLSARVGSRGVKWSSDVHLSRELLGDVFEQALLAVRQDVIDRPSPPDGDGSRCRPRLDGEAQSQARLSQHPRRARVRREAQEAALSHAGGSGQGRCFCRRGPAAVKCAFRTCVVRDRQRLSTQAPCEPEDDGVICAAGVVRGRGINC